MTDNNLTAADLLDIIEHKHSKKEIDDAHKKLQDTVSNIDRETLEALCIRLVYSVDALK